VAQGLANCVAAFAGGLPVAASPSPTTAAFNAGGRTRLVGVVAALCLLMLTVMFPDVLAAIPHVVLSGLLMAIGIQLFDRWSIAAIRGAFRRLPWHQRRRAWFDLLIMLVVTAITASVSVIAGMLAGLVLACGVFIVDMSRPIVRRMYTGLSSKRFRGADEAAVLRSEAARRVVFDLEGVLFFGNADDLSRTVTDILKNADAIILDLRRIADIDVSGAAILAALFERTRKKGKWLLFCNVPAVHVTTVAGIAAAAAESVMFPDRDSALEWIEEQVLLTRVNVPHHADILPLERHDFTRGLDGREIVLLRRYLSQRELPAGTILCAGGTPADCMWLLMRGSVSVRLSVASSGTSRRMASLAAGTITGSMALLGSGSRMVADVVADEAVTAYELQRTAFERLLEEHPVLAAKLLINVGRELSRRLNTTFGDFREVVD
jgi:CRP-like cAMP-binding protein/anti-anti-sigma regulatory factor